MDPEILRQKNEEARKKREQSAAKRLLEQQELNRNVRVRGDTLVVNRPPNPQTINYNANNNQSTNMLRTNNNTRPLLANGSNFRMRNGNSAPRVFSEKVMENKSNKKKVKLVFALVDRDTFSVVAEWDDQLNKLLKAESLRFQDRKFFMALTNYKPLHKKLPQLTHLDIDLEGLIPDFVPEMLQHYRTLRENNDPINLLERIEKQTYDKLHDYQKEGIMFAIRLNARCYFADEMGLGKSVQALCAMKWFQEDWPLLIVCTKSLVPKWRDDVQKWLTDLKDHEIYIPKDGKQILQRAPITIMSYNMLTSYHSTLEVDCFYRSMILDESHNVKEVTSQRTKACMDVSQKFMKHIVLLSGTPVLNRPKELWTQFSMVYENFPKWLPFANRYCDPQKQHKRGRGGRVIVVTSYDGSSNVEELNLLITNTFMIQRTKEGELDLPSKVRELSAINIDLNPNDLQLMNERDKEFSVHSREISDEKERVVPKASIQWFQETARVKAPAVVKRLRELIQTKLKMLIFFHHQIMRDAVLEMLIETQTNHIVIDGNTSMKDREDAVNKFQSKPRIRVALLSLKACNTGLNLTAANTVVFAELYWTPSELYQAEARIHRIGQTEPCRCIYLFAKKTVDERIYKTLIDKLNVISKAGLKTDENFDRLFAAPGKQTTMDDYLVKATEEDTDEIDDFFLEDDGLDDLLRDI